MKKKVNFFILLLICSLLLSVSLFTTSKLQNNSIEPKLKAIETPPVILFDTSDMALLEIFRIIVFDTDSNLSSVSVYHNNVLLNVSADFTVSWTFGNYTYNPLPLSLLAYPNADPNTDTFEGEIDVSNVFVPGVHNNITVEAENIDGLGSSAMSVFCREVECWGGGGGASTPTEPDYSVQAQTNIPNIIFDLTCYFRFGRIHTYIEGNGAIIEAYTIEKINETLKVWAYTDETVEYVAGVTLDADIDILNVTCPECEECEECIELPCEETSLQFVPILASLFLIVAIFTLRKKRK